MRAGFAEVEFTPPEGFMPGEFKAYYAKGAYTPLQANAAAFTNGGETVILISADYLLFRTDYANSIRTKISEKTGVAVEKILLAATHTHMGPSMDTPCWKSPAEPEIASVVAHRIVTAAVKAFENQTDGVKIGVGRGEERRFSFCRDVVLADGTIKTNAGIRPDILRTCDTPDYAVEIMRIERDGKIAAIMVNYANHPDSNSRSRERNKFCADWPGFLRIALKEKYGEDVVVLFFNGCCGDVNHLDFLNGTHLKLHMAEGVVTPEVIGRGLADTVAGVMDGIVADEKDETLRAECLGITVKRRQITDVERAWAAEVIERTKTEYVSASEYGTANAYVKTGDNVPETEIFSVYGYRIGPWGIIAMPGEMYTALGRSIKQGSPFEHTIAVELANGHHGYVIPDHVRENGSYEGRFSSGTTGFGAFEAIINGAVETLKKIY